MRSSLLDPRVSVFPACAVLLLVAAGCQSGGNAAGVLDSGDPAKPAEQKVTEAELRGFCPRVTLRDGTSTFNVYAKGGQDDPTKIVYQVSLSDVSRSCAAADGMLTMKVAVAGRVVPGPAFSAGTVTMPVCIAATRGSEVLYSQLNQHQVAVTDASAATLFVFNDPNVSFPMPPDRAVQVYAGFDDAPAKKRN